MKKHLFKCFLALLCLFGSETSSQSRVAESPPGADLLHRFSGPHREGISLPDTFSRIDFGLVDSDQDLGAGKEAFGLLSAPVTVSASPNSAYDSHSTYLSAVEIDGGEVRSSGYLASGKDSSALSSPVFVYGEIRSGALADSVLVTFWEKYLGRYVSYVGMEASYVSLGEGSMLQGASGKKVLQYTSQPISEFGYLSIASVLGDQYLDRYLVEPGDSLIFSLDLRLGQLVFAGPDATKFELQHRLALEEQAASFIDLPAFHLQPGQDPSALKESFEASSPLVSGYAPRWMEFVAFGEKRRNWMEERLKRLPSEDSRLSILEEYRDRISDHFLAILRADVLGENAAKSISLIKNLPLESRAESQKHLKGYLERIGELKVSDTVAQSSAFFQEYLLERESLLAVYAGEGLFTRLEAKFSGRVYDRLVGRFLFENYSRLPDFGNAVARVSERIADQEIRSGLLSLAAAHRVGSLVQELPLMDMHGDSTDLRDYQGKTVLLAFWFPGCLPSKLLHERQLSKVQEAFADREDFALLSINTDPDPARWKAYLSDNPSYSFGNEHLFLGGRDMHPFLKFYDIQAYPSLMLIDGEGKLIRSLKMPSQAEGMIELITENLSENHLNTNQK